MQSSMSKGRVWATSEDGKIEYVSLTKDYLQEFIDVLKKSFFQQENLFKATGLAGNLEAIEDLNEPLSQLAKKGISVVAIDKETGKLAGALLNDFEEKNASSQIFVEFIVNWERPVSKNIINIGKILQKDYDPYALYNVDCLLNLKFLGVLPEYSTRGIGFKLCDVSLELATELYRGKNVKTPLDDNPLPLEPRPQIVVSCFTSFKSQKIARKLKFDIVKTISLDDLYVDGKSFTNILGNETKEFTKECKRLN